LRVKYVKYVEDTFGESKFIPNRIQENYQVKLPDWFWDKIGVKIEIMESDKGFSYYDNEFKTIYLTKDWSGYTRTKLIWQSSITHELGHAYHYNTKMINDESAKFIFKAFYKKGIKMTENLTDVQKKLLDARSFFTNFDKLKEKYKGKITDVEVRRMLAITNDLFAALTEGKLGFGHAKSYWQDSIRKYQEFFANSADIHFNGNLILEDSFPEIVSIIKEFWKNEKNN
jgi:hypothetical protein